jgi:hypothetical protein
MSRARDLSKLANPSVFSVDTSNNIGINSTSPDAKLDVVGVVSATQFFGDGSELSGITAGATLSAGSGDQRVVLTSLTSGTMTTAATDAELSYNSSTNTLSATTFSGNATGLSGTPNISVGTITASGNVSVAGTLTYEDVRNVDSVGLITARSGIRIGTGGTVGPASTGIVTYYGDGQYLTGISAGGISTFAGTASGIVTTLNLTNQDHKVTVTGVTTITVSGGTEGDSHTVRVVNSGVSTVGFSTYFLFPSGSVPVLPTADGAISLISFTVHRAGSTGIATQLLGGAALNFS